MWGACGVLVDSAEDTEFNSSFFCPTNCSRIRRARDTNHVGAFYTVQARETKP
jgi:hypothetical protein